jgi:hypothetical protein
MDYEHINRIISKKSSKNNDTKREKINRKSGKTFNKLSF